MKSYQSRDCQGAVGVSRYICKKNRSLTVAALMFWSA